MMRPTATFEDAFCASKNRVGLSVVTLLAWIAYSDGHVAPEEEAALRAVAEKSLSRYELNLALAVAEHGHPADLQLACETVGSLPNRDARRQFLELMVGMSLADGYLVNPEIHVLMLLADSLSLGFDELRVVFREITGSEFPSPSDPSSRAWWELRERKGKSSSSSSAGQSANERPSTAPVDMQMLKDLAVLGLDEDANADEIQAAYRRMAQVHHPDKYSAIGPEAVAAAEQSFRRIQAAYDRLARA